MSIPKYRRAAKEIADYIRRRRIMPGSRLPGGRKLTDMLGVSKNTVYEALEFLRENGVIEIRGKAGCFAAETAYESMDKLNWGSYLDKGWQEAKVERPLALDTGGRIINLCSIASHESFGYYDYFLKALDIFRSEKEKLPLLRDTDIQGSYALRLLIAERMKEYGIETKPENIIINAGVESSVDVFVRSLLSAGDTIYTEEPAAFPLYTVASAIGVNVVSVPMDSEGIDIEALKRVFRKKGRSILLITTFCHIPTGINMSSRRRRAVFKFCAEADIPMIEIDCQWYPDKKFKPIRALDKDGGRVIYSKGIFMPVTIGMNIGWVIVPDNLVPKISAVLAQTSPYPFSLNGRILEIMFSEGLYDGFLEELAPKFRKRRDMAWQLIEKYLSPHVSWGGDGMGVSRDRGFPSHVPWEDRIVFWVRLKDSIDTLKLFRINKNLVILPGSIFGKKFSQYIFILPYAVPDNELEEGFKALGSLIENCIK